MSHHPEYDAKDAWILARKYHETLCQYTSHEPTTHVAVHQSILLFAGLTIGRHLASAQDTTHLEEALDTLAANFRQYLQIGIVSAKDPDQVPLPFS